LAGHIKTSLKRATETKHCCHYFEKSLYTNCNSYLNPQNVKHYFFRDITDFYQKIKVIRPR